MADWEGFDVEGRLGVGSDGDGVAGPPAFVGPAGRAQGARPRTGRRPGRAGAPAPRGAGARPAGPPQLRGGLQLPRVGLGGGHRHGVRRGRLTADTHREGPAQRRAGPLRARRSAQRARRAHHRASSTATSSPRTFSSPPPASPSWSTSAWPPRWAPGGPRAPAAPPIRAPRRPPASPSGWPATSIRRVSCSPSCSPA